MITKTTPLWLGSGSPRRRELLEQLGVPLHVAPTELCEDVLPGELPDEYLCRITEEKLHSARHAALGAGLQGGAPGPACAAILVADTTVVIDQEILGKPARAEHAQAMLERLVGRWHQVMTRYAFAYGHDFGRKAERTCVTRVQMRPLAPQQVADYVRVGEGRDKAGGYAVQGIGAYLIRRLEGSYSNVVGLPLCELIEDLQERGLLAQVPLAFP